MWCFTHPWRFHALDTHDKADVKLGPFPHKIVDHLIDWLLTVMDWNQNSSPAYWYIIAIASFLNFSFVVFSHLFYLSATIIQTICTTRVVFKTNLGISARVPSTENLENVRRFTRVSEGQISSYRNGWLVCFHNRFVLVDKRRPRVFVESSFSSPCKVTRHL